MLPPGGVGFVGAELTRPAASTAELHNHKMD
jgi:hypothetical protein